MLRACLALCRTILPLRVPLLTMSTTASSVGAASTRLPGNLLIREHTLKVPIDHAKPRSGEIDLFVRELVPASKASDDSLPCIMYLQGGPGFPSGRPTSPARSPVPSRCRWTYEGHLYPGVCQGVKRGLASRRRHWESGCAA